ncbi:M14 family zinc carboxypeptidase [Flavobacterium acetivorans]|uniref:M14 family zinc carboxypeptidase n=1 Tax=Flavobacterium acetivorans TaxID=2893883 RepID=UPI001E52150D|nr:M14 family zinc carboxypeptidase [Flavobacterium sp. F-29]UFH34024.1 zinc carboxypeptidase [Flavobacterium sp. F-29]
MKYFYPICLLFSFLTHAQQQPTLDYYLPQNITYSKNIPTPKSIFHFELGEMHTDHTQVAQYMNEVAKASNRVSIETIGYTFENKPLQLLTISSPKNLADIDQILKRHQAITDSGANNSDLSDLPVVIYLGYSIHGNESSGTGAAIALAYYLAAAESPELEKTLDKTIILLDPSLNPDGLQRFSTWVNSNKSTHLVTDPNDREFNEMWPKGRFNHYWFDMNRDWLPVQLPESQARIRTYRKWMPNVLCDFHEMGTNATYFFQPGEPSRTNPLTPELNQILTQKIATYHAKALDKIGSSYFIEENYDDFYYGKGSSYPDINGSIGILFEQASSRGHAQESANGILTFPFTIRNQFTTSLSSLQAAYEMRKELLEYQRDFYIKAKNDSKNSKTKAYIFGDEKDATRVNELAKILHQHKIEMLELKEDITINKKKFNKNLSYIIPVEQKNTKLINAIFDRQTKFKDSLFYDISTWSFDLAFNLNFEGLNSLSQAGAKYEPKAKTGFVSKKSDIGYLIEWTDYESPKLLNQILSKNLRIRTSKQPFTHNGKTFSYGSLFLPVQNQEMNSEEIFNYLSQIIPAYAIEITGTETGLTEGINLGNPNFITLSQPQVAMVVGQGVDPSDAGEIWHLFDQKATMPLTKINIDQLQNVNLNRYTTLVLANGNYSSFSTKTINKIEQWIQNGGTLIAYQDVIKWLNDSKFIDLTFKTVKNEAKDISFEQSADYRGAQLISGAIFETKLDLSHPINFGMPRDKMPIFRNTSIIIEPNKNSYNNPIQYTKSPLISGYISKQNLELLKESVPFQSIKRGDGKIIIFTDNTNFRAFWLGTEKLFWNAIFFSKLM